MFNDFENLAARADDIFRRAVEDYHIFDSTDTPEKNPFPVDSPEALLYSKTWTDAVQWHLEDIIRDPKINPVHGMEIKHRIDKLNQQRTDMVEQVDAILLGILGNVEPQPGARLNTESPAWALDRLSILSLKIWHMREQAQRQDASMELREKAATRLEVLNMQHADLLESISTLLCDLQCGAVRPKVYLQMKLYNDPRTNPALYDKK